jgi:hypothetical protein
LKRVNKETSMPFDQQGLTVQADTATTPENSTSDAAWPFYLFAAVVVLAWAVSAVLFGLPGLYIPAVCAVPVVWVMLIVISLG